jgi:hypothetical protein
VDPVGSLWVQVVGCCKYDDEPACSGVMVLVTLVS